MQAEANILERIAQAYVARRGVRLLCALSVAGAALLLFVLAGGFPPFAWRLLARALPQFSALETAHGGATLLALLSLILLSITILLAWGTLLWLSWKMLAYWLYERQELRNFAADVEQAHYLADDEEAAYATQYTTALDDNGLYPGEAGEEFLEEEEEELGFYQDMDEQAEDETGFYPDQDEEESFWEADRERAEVEEVDKWDEVGNAASQAEWRANRLAAFHARSMTGELYPQDRMPYQAARSLPPEPPTRVPARSRVSAPGQHPASISSPYIAPASDPHTQANATMPAYPAVYDQQIIEHSGLDVYSDNIKHSSYGRVVPFAPVSTSEARTRPATGLYARVPLSSAGAVTPEPAMRGLTAQLIVSTGLDVGLTRKGKPNEDSLLALHNTRMLRGSPCPVGLFVVADGMGGHAKGQEASRLVIQSLSRTIVPSIIYGPTDDNYAELLAEGVHHANLEIYQRNRQEKVNMGTTIAATLVVDTTAYVVNAGDSRVYLYRASSGLSQVTRDHSTVARLVENGLIQPDDIYTHPRRNEIYRSLGHHPSEDLDRFILALQPDDLLLLCSDGLWEMVRDSQIEQVIASTLHQPTQISDALVQAALAGGGKDNISVIVVCIKAVEAVQAVWAAG